MVIQPLAKVPPPHRHVDVDETIQVLEGSLTYRVDDCRRVLKAGDSCFSTARQRSSLLQSGRCSRSRAGGVFACQHRA
nr:cupin domain-containing protein [Pararobbsia alpina]